MAYDLTDYKDESYGLLDKGDYEVVLDKIEIKQSSNGNEYANLQYKVRNDVDQSFKNRVLFDTLFKEKDKEGRITGFYNRARITKILKAIFPENTPLNFQSAEDIFETMVGHKLIVNVNQRHDDYFGEDRNYIAYFKPTKHGDKTLDTSAVAEVKNESPKQTGSEKESPFESTKYIISEDDLPF